MGAFEDKRLTDIQVSNELTLLPTQYKALEKLASNNNVEFEYLLGRVTISDNVIIRCNFSDSNLTTLDGLHEVWSIKELDVCGNRLTSLKGIPTQEIQGIYAIGCGLIGDLAALATAHKLRVLNVSNNHYLTSLKGIATQEIEVIIASCCGLTGDLLGISEATNLNRLDVAGNRHLTSLKGISTQEIEQIYASCCGLTGDHTFLSEARKLQSFFVDDNPLSLTLDRSIFLSVVKW